MDSVKPNFSGAHEELLEDAVSIEDIDEVLEKLATAGISGTETDEPVIGEVAEVEAGKLHVYHGGWTAYREAKGNTLAAMELEESTAAA